MPPQAQFEIAPEDGSHRLGLLGYHNQLLVDAAIAERNRTSDPDALALGGRDLVPHPLPDKHPLELREGEQHVEGEPAHAAGRVERLGHGLEGHGMGRRTSSGQRIVTTP